MPYMVGFWTLPQNALGIPAQQDELTDVGTPKEERLIMRTPSPAATHARSF